MGHFAPYKEEKIQDDRHLRATYTTLSKMAFVYVIMNTNLVL